MARTPPVPRRDDSPDPRRHREDGPDHAEPERRNRTRQELRLESQGRVFRQLQDELTRLKAKIAQGVRERRTAAEQAVRLANEIGQHNRDLTVWRARATQLTSSLNEMEAVATRAMNLARGVVEARPPLPPRNGERQELTAAGGDAPDLHPAVQRLQAALDQQRRGHLGQGRGSVIERLRRREQLIESIANSVLPAAPGGAASEATQGEGNWEAIEEVQLD